MTRSHNRTERQIARLLAALESGPKTRAQLQVEPCLSESVVGTYVRLLTAKPRRIRIAGYATKESQHGSRPAIYALGANADAPRPKRKSGAQLFKELKADSDRHERRLQKRRALWHVAAAKKKPNTWLSALGAM